MPGCLGGRGGNRERSLKDLTTGGTFFNGDSGRESIKGHLRLRLRSKGSPLLREVVISSCLLGERKLLDYLFRPDSERSLSNEHLTESGRELVPIPYGNRTRVFDMKRRCPNHWTKGTKSHSSYTSAPRIEVVRFVSIRN